MERTVQVVSRTLCNTWWMVLSRRGMERKNQMIIYHFCLYRTCPPYIDCASEPNQILRLGIFHRSWNLPCAQVTIPEIRTYIIKWTNNWLLMHDQHPVQDSINGFFVAIVHTSLHRTGRPVRQVFLIIWTEDVPFLLWTLCRMLIETDHQVHVTRVHTLCCKYVMVEYQ